MRSVDFPQANIPLAKDQPEYQTLYVHHDLTSEDREVTACMELSQDEIVEIVATGKIWHTQVTFGNGYHPIRMSTKSPYPELNPPRPPADENRVPADEWDKTHFLSPGGDINKLCHNCGKAWFDHFWSERQCIL